MSVLELKLGQVTLSLTGSCPCEVTSRGKECGKPAVRRALVYCRACVMKTYVFLCVSHDAMFAAGKLSCRYCHAKPVTEV